MKMTTEQFLSHLGIEVGKPYLANGHKFEVDSGGRLLVDFNDDALITPVNWLLDKEITPLPKYTLSEEQKNMIRAIPKEYKWFGRDYDGIWAFTLEPKFDYDYKDFGCVGGFTADLRIFDDLLVFVKEDEKVNIDELRKCL